MWCLQCTDGYVFFFVFRPASQPVRTSSLRLSALFKRRSTGSDMTHKVESAEIPLRREPVSYDFIKFTISVS